MGDEGHVTEPIGLLDPDDVEDELESAVERGDLEATLSLLDRGGIATEKLVALADRNLHMKLAQELRKRAGLFDPFRDDPRGTLVVLAKQLGHHARASAEASGDLGYYEGREDLDAGDLCIEYWLGHYKSVVREAFDAIDEEARRALPEREALLQELYDAYCAGYDSASGS
ncbi:MAG TPA: hypothetical protein VGM39_13750 [Kofleriaceae bacterium]|jgi:hypothetical protein